ncbi:MAG: L-threonylcarbamoyladenylate synthase [Acidobacteriota bacterium]|nr:L-threonylcarbamoyladenylate synthase [Acidobacteriota bacterium]
MKHADTKTWILLDGAEARSIAAAAIKRGEVIAFRTDTFYGLGVDPFNRRAVAKIKALKGRAENKPLLIVVSDAEEATRFVADKNQTFSTLVASHWPGALTVVVRARREVPEELTAGTGTIGVRWPAAACVRKFVRACGGALTATSANPAGEVPACSADEVAAYFPAGLALIVDSGRTVAEQPSTVVEVCGAEVRLIREGAVAWSALHGRA